MLVLNLRKGPAAQEGETVTDDLRASTAEKPESEAVQVSDPWGCGKAMLILKQYFIKREEEAKRAWALWAKRREEPGNYDVAAAKEKLCKGMMECWAMFWDFMKQTATDNGNRETAL